MSVKSVTYMCPNCGAALEFDNRLGKHKCFYCDSVFDEQQMQQLFSENEQTALDTADPELTEAQREAEEFSGASALYTCPECGAGVICGELEASVRCHFCHTPVILSGRLSGEFRPDLIIPFAITKEVAQSAFAEYTKGKFLLPSGFKKNARVVDISALYVPYWLKSGLADADMKANCKRVRTWRVGDTRYTNTKYYDSYRSAELAFIRVPCDGSKRIDDALMESIEPFNYSNIKKFSMSYLTGCAAEKYDVPLEDAEKRIDERISEAAADVLKADITEQGYTTVTPVYTNLSFMQKNAVYALLPVWFINYRYDGKDYPFVMNGQTGANFGILPVSKLKTALFSAGVFAALFALSLLLGMVFG
ncbi:MAG: hypothetical protein ACI4KA_08385 [Oscillospiraceae bacterium]